MLVSGKTACCFQGDWHVLFYKYLGLLAHAADTDGSLECFSDPLKKMHCLL